MALVAIAGFLVLPPIVKAQAARRASDELGRTVTIGNVRMNPFALSITLEDVNVKEKDSPASFLGWTRLYVRFDALASLAGDWVLGEIELSGFHAAVVVNPNGSFNFFRTSSLDLCPAVEGSGEAGTPDTDRGTQR